jgi:prepilin peptidase CpaA
VPLLLKLTLLAIAIAGGLADLRTRRIPNWLNVSGLILGLGLNTLFLRGDGFRLALMGFGLALLVYLPLYLIRAMGAGDVKFMAAIGAIIGPQNWLGLFLATAILGGVASLCLVLARGRLYLTLMNVSTIATELIHGRMPFHKDPSLDVHDKRAVGLPHGTLIAIAAVIFLAFLYGWP